MLDDAVARLTRSACGGLAEVRSNSPAYAAGFWLSDDDDIIDLFPMCVGLERDLGRGRDLDSSYGVFRNAWNVSEYTIQGVRPKPDPRNDTVLQRDLPALLSALYAHDVTDPVEWVVNRVARRVTEMRPIPHAAEHFISFVFNEDFAEGLLANLWASATPQVATALHARGLLPKQLSEVSDEHEDF